MINKSDLAPLVHADLEVMREDASRARGDRPFTFLSLVDDPLAQPVSTWLEDQLVATGAVPS